MEEIESKNTLCSPEDFQKLLAFLGFDEDGKEIENFYLDTPNLELRKARKMLRLRRDSEWKITLKGPTQEQSGVFTRQEQEFSTSPAHAKNILKTGQSIEVTKWAGLTPEDLLIVVAHCRVIRHTKRTGSMEIALDHVFLDDGTEYFELEVEAESVEKSATYTKALLESARVCARASVMSKYGYSLQHTKH